MDVNSGVISGAGKLKGFLPGCIISDVCQFATNIINHGDGYMSLYGHNQSLYRQTGDWVAANEVISTAGTSGGQEKPGLYFEIRQKGEPKNPTTWCTARA